MSTPQYIILYIITVQIFYHRLEVGKQPCNFPQLVNFLSYVGAQGWLFCSEVEKLLFLGMMYRLYAKVYK